MKHDPTFWLLARSTGLLAYAFATATVVAGLTLKTRLLRSVRLASVTDVHRVLSLAGLVAVAAHATSLVLDETVKVTPLAVFVPGLVDYRTVWSAVGVVTLELMAIIHISFRLRRRIGVKNWRRLHYFTYLVFAGATVHGLLTGTDSDRMWALGIYAVAVGLVVSLTFWRIDSVKVAAAARAAQASQRATAPAADRRAAVTEQVMSRTAAPPPAGRPRELAKVGAGAAGPAPAPPARSANDAPRIRPIRPRFDTGLGPAQPSERPDRRSHGGG